MASTQCFVPDSIDLLSRALCTVSVAATGAVSTSVVWGLSRLFSIQKHDLVTAAAFGAFSALTCVNGRCIFQEKEKLYPKASCILRIAVIPAGATWLLSQLDLLPNAVGPYSTAFYSAATIVGLTILVKQNYCG